MVTRRELLTAAVVAGARAAMGKASQPATAVSFAVPAGACDCHTHIFGDPAKFPFTASRVYTPETALPEEMSALHRALHIQRVVIVTPSVYGTDNSATLYGMKARGGDARGVAVIDERTAESELQAMDRAGVRGIRLNLSTAGQNDPGLARRMFQAAAERMQRHNWHVQMNTNLAVISGIQDLVRTSPVPVVFDHFGGVQAALGQGQAGWRELVELVRSGKAYVKISDAYDNSTLAPDYPDLAPFARALIGANLDRILWGSDWPHPPGTRPRDLRVMPFRQVDDGRLLSLLAVWAPDEVVRRKILVDNPSRLYRF